MNVSRNNRVTTHAALISIVYMSSCVYNLHTFKDKTDSYIDSYILNV